MHIRIWSPLKITRNSSWATATVSCEINWLYYTYFSLKQEIPLTLIHQYTTRVSFETRLCSINVAWFHSGLDAFCSLSLALLYSTPRFFPLFINQNLTLVSLTDLSCLSVLFSQYRSCDDTWEVWTFVVYIKKQTMCEHENNQTSKKILSWVLSHDLCWENKIDKQKRFIGRVTKPCLIH